MQDWLFSAISSYSTTKDRILMGAIEERPYLIREKTHLGETLLHLAAKYHRSKLIGFLVNKGLEPDEKDCLDQTAFDLADSNGANLLKKYKRKLNKRWVTLNSAIKEHDIERVKKSLNTLPNLNASGVRSDILTLLVFHDFYDEDICRQVVNPSFLIDHKILTKYLEGFLQTNNCSDDLVKFLIQNGASQSKIPRSVEHNTINQESKPSKVLLQKYHNLCIEKKPLEITTPEEVDKYPLQKQNRN